MKSLCKSELCTVRCGQLLEPFVYLSRQGYKKRRIFKDFRRETMVFFSLFSDRTTFIFWLEILPKNSGLGVTYDVVQNKKRFQSEN